MGLVYRTWHCIDCCRLFVIFTSVRQHGSNGVGDWSFPHYAGCGIFIAWMFLQPFLAVINLIAAGDFK